MITPNKARISYDAEGHTIDWLDDGLKKLFADHGYSFCGDGYNFYTGIRDIAFEREERGNG